MKQVLRIVLVAVLLMTTVLSIVACGEDTPPTPTPDVHTCESKCPTCGKCTDASCTEDACESKCEGHGSNLPTVDLSTAKFQDKNVTYNGKEHKINNISGAPMWAEKIYRYYEAVEDGTDADGNPVYKKGALVCEDDGDKDDKGVKEVGVYIVEVEVIDEGYESGYMTAILTIAQPYYITYTSNVPGATLPDSNPTTYSQFDAARTLSDASFPMYKFKGWTLNGKPITTIDPKSPDFQGDITIEAQFQLYRPYPTVPYEPTYEPVTGRPDTLPAIPGYDDLPDDAFLLYDMTTLRPYAEKPEDVNLYYVTGIKSEDEANGKVYAPTHLVHTTAGGQPVFEWVDFSDQVNVDQLKEYYNGDEELIASLYGDGYGLFKKNDGYYVRSIRFTGANAGDYSKYDTVEFWVYSAAATGKTMGFTFWCNHNDNSTARETITIDWTGWKKFSFSYSNFTGVQNGSVSNQHELRLLAESSVYGQNDFSLDLNASQENYLFFSNIYLTNNASDYTGRLSVADERMLYIMEQYSKNTYNLTDAELAKVDDLFSTWSDANNLWGADLTSNSGINETYENILLLAKAWNAPDTGYYQDLDTLNMVVDSLNFMSDNDYFGKTITNKAYATLISYADYVPTIDALTRITMIIGDHIEHTHAKTWMAPVIALCPYASGSGNFHLETATYSAMAYLTSGNKKNFLTSIRAMLHCFASGENPDVSDASALFLASVAGTEFAPTYTCAQNLFSYLLNVIDAGTYKGETKTNIGSQSAVVNATYFALMRDLFGDAEKATLDAIVKSYLDKDSVVDTSIQQIGAYVDAVNASAASRDSEVLTHYNKELGYAVYKDASTYLYISTDGTVITEGIDATITVGGYLDAYVQDGKLAITTATHAIFAYEGGVIVSTDAIGIVESDFSVYVSAGGADAETFTDHMDTDGVSKIIVFSSVKNGLETFTVHYTGDADSISFYILSGNNYDVSGASTEDCTISLSAGMITVVVNTANGNTDTSFQMYTMA